jgi:HrpA-like RNA helicase
MKFDYIDRPPKNALDEAIVTLHHLGALDEAHVLTEIGHQMVKLPLEPRVSSVQLIVRSSGCAETLGTIAFKSSYCE